MIVSFTLSPGVCCKGPVAEMPSPHRPLCRVCRDLGELAPGRDSGDEVASAIGEAWDSWEFLTTLRYV